MNENALKFCRRFLKGDYYEAFCFSDKGRAGSGKGPSMRVCLVRNKNYSLFILFRHQRTRAVERLEGHRCAVEVAPTLLLAHTGSALAGECKRRSRLLVLLTCMVTYLPTYVYILGGIGITYFGRLRN